MSAPMTPEQVRSEALAEAATLVREHQHPGDNPAEFYAGLLADAARPRVRRFTPLEEAVQGIETAIAPLTGDAKAGADMDLAYLRTLTTPNTAVPRDLRPGAETARRMIADRQTAEDPHDSPLHRTYETSHDLPEVTS